ncbi:MAG: type transport system permease protein [Thermoleophilaceae bacterium]|nr:type transport system permease protein [Thermoleophilaceae bacterium]
MNASLAYMRFELLRTIRNRRVFVFSLAFPIVLYVLIAAPNRHEQSLGGTGISAPLYFMIGLASFGTMNAMLSSGSRIAAERTAGWNRQLRITPLTTRQYFRAKIVTSYLLAIVALLALYVAGAALGVSLPANRWLAMTGLIIVGLIPFAAMGVLLGHLLTADSVGPAIGGTTAIFAFLGGSWFPITGGGFLEDLAKDLPSYWVVHAARAGLGVPHPWGTHGWAVVAIWSVAMIVLAGRAYQRDTERV